MKSYTIYYPIYLIKDGKSPEIIAILKVKYNTDNEDKFIIDYIESMPGLSIIYAEKLRKLFSSRFQMHQLNNRMRTLLIRLACIEAVDWKRIIWKEISWRQYWNLGCSIYINTTGDDILVSLEREIDASDADILIAFGSIPVVTLNRLSIKETLIWIWKRYIMNR